jgi:small subunit ribosomal protein S4
MGRYTGPKIRQSRKFGEALTTKAEKYLAKRNYRAGQHGQNPARVSEFGVQLREKQKAKAIYGVMEKQFRRYYEKATKKVGVTGDALMSMLEMRLDNFVFRMGLALTRPQARQLVNHAFFEVNGKKVDIPSYALKVGDEVRVRETKNNSGYIKNVLPTLKNVKTPEWVAFNEETLVGKVLSVPNRDQIGSTVNTQLIVEHYSR